ncbi:Endoribonuclease L-PSP/chorismate mutase-like protein [Trichoderma austrokoningii]
MSGLKFYSYEGMGQQLLRDWGDSQAVHVGDRIEVCGQGGWRESLDDMPTDAAAQIDNAFANVEKALKAAGGKGWSQVFRVNTTHLPLNDEAVAAVQLNFKKYMPDHQPLWTAVGIQRFAADRMAVEIEAVAYDPEGAKTAGI